MPLTTAKPDTASHLQTPVVLIIFNRPETTRQVFTAIAKAKPSRLFIVADGPRADHPEDEEKCAATRAVVEKVDWDCEVYKNYAQNNLGCGYRPATGINWALEQVEEAIILEDDCIPHPSFFPFCAELLERYRDDERVMMISGRNHLGKTETPYSYFFGHLMTIWGWATWRRAWRHHDMKIRLWPLLRETPWLLDLFGDPRFVAYWQHLFDQTHECINNVDTWDYQWMFACWAQHGLAITPRVNLVSNVGFGEEATHTKWAHDPRAQVPVEEMPFPLHHPPYMVRDKQGDDQRLELILPARQKRPLPLSRRIRRKLLATLPRPLREQVASFKACLKAGWSNS